MRLCLSCRRLSPGGSAFCGYCARSFGSRLCANKHRNPPHVLCCTTCASPELTETADFVPLGCLPMGLALLCGLLVWRWCLSHLWGIVSTTWGLALWLVGLLMGLSPCALHRLLRNAVSGLLALWLLGWLLTLLPGRGGAAGTWLRGLPGEAFEAAWGGTRWLLRMLGHGLRRAVVPPPSKSKSGSHAKSAPHDVHKG